MAAQNIRTNLLFKTTLPTHTRNENKELNSFV